MKPTKKPEHKRTREQGLEDAWKWVLRAMGIVGFGYLLMVNPNVPAYLYVLVGGLLGLPTAIERQISANRERSRGGNRDDQE